MSYSAAVLVDKLCELGLFRMPGLLDVCRSHAQQNCRSAKAPSLVCLIPLVLKVGSGDLQGVLYGVPGGLQLNDSLEPNGPCILSVQIHVYTSQS